jgi:menaquinol-cytochrome c reductase iron-sulfur subunit
VPMQVDDLKANRRGFMTGAMYGLLAAIGFATGIPAFLYMSARPKEDKQSQWVDAGELSNLPVGSPREISFRRNRTDGWMIRSEKDVAWVIKNDDASVTAFSPWCTHLGCAYRWDSVRSQFNCPCHGSAFSKTGGVISGPAPRPLDRYDVKLEGKRVWLGMTQKPERPLL